MKTKKPKKAGRLAPDIEKQILEHAETKSSIEALIQLWKDRLYLGTWTIDATYEWNGIPARSDDNRYRFVVHGECRASWQYQKAHLRFDLPECSTLDSLQLEDVVVHELMHVVVNEMQSDRDINHEERVVTHLTNALLWAWRQTEDS